MSKLIFLACFFCSCSPPKSANDPDGNTPGPKSGGSSQNNSKQSPPFHQQKSSSCARTGAQLTGTKLKNDSLSLDDSVAVDFFSGDELLSQLKAVTVEVQIKKKSGKSASCTGIVSFIVYQVWIPRGNSGSKSNIIFPKIETAAHCIATDNDTELESIGFVLSSDTAKKAAYTVQVKAPQISFLQDGVNTIWQFDQSKIGLGRPRVGCAQEKGACFSAFQDRVEFITTAENSFKTEIYSPALNGVKSHGVPIVEASAKLAPYFEKDAFEFLPEESQSLNYKFILKSAINHAFSSSTSDQHFLLRDPIKSKEEFVKKFDEQVEQIIVVRPVHGKDELPFFERDKPASGWSELFSFNLEEHATGVLFDSLVLKENAPRLGSGDSGSKLVARYKSVHVDSGVLFKAEYGVETIGTLSYVDQKPVCSGDDLLCCERSE